MRASRVADSVDGSLRAVRWSDAFIVSCALIAWTHETVGWISILLIWIGHITITGAELWQSAAVAHPAARAAERHLVRIGAPVGT